ncbi:CPT-6 protein, partial [Aphelenchoides avenae]
SSTSFRRTPIRISRTLAGASAQSHATATVSAIGSPETTRYASRFRRTNRPRTRTQT